MNKGRRICKSGLSLADSNLSSYLSCLNIYSVFLDFHHFISTMRKGNITGLGGVPPQIIEMVEEE
jgi:hypothetical protein